MDRTQTPHDPAVAAVAAVSPARRRWSDGPGYPVTCAAQEDGGVAAQWPALAAVLCEEVAGGTNELAREVERLRGQGRLARGDAQALRRTMRSMRSTGLALQQIVRLGAGQFNLSPDRIELGGLACTVVREHARELLRRQIETSLDLRRAEVWIDGAVAAGLIRAGLDWASSFSRKVRVKVVPGGEEEPARLVIRGALPSVAGPSRAGNRRMNDNLHWVLMRQLAACARLPVSRSSSAATESVIVDFPATIATGVHSRR
jgi:hypothetical protein